jgi:lathosterol oxidase
VVAICYAVERTNPNKHEEGRWLQIKREIIESIPAVVASTSVSLFHMNYVYPWRWGFEAPVFPSSLKQAAIEFVYWMLMFEVTVYVLHRLLHVRRPIDIYKHIHRAHHLFFFPSAFASQAIHPIEAIMFAETSLIASIFLMPISVLTQYACGILLLAWSIFAHDSRFLLDKGMHYEHHR